MTAIISSNIWDKRCQEKEQFPNPSECIREYWGEQEQRYMHEISLPSGLEIIFDRFHFREAIIEQLSPHKLWPEFAFQVSGKRQLMNGNSHQGGENFLAIGRYPQGQQQKKKENCCCERLLAIFQSQPLGTLPWNPLV